MWGGLFNMLFKYSRRRWGIRSIVQALFPYWMLGFLADQGKDLPVVQAGSVGIEVIIPSIHAVIILSKCMSILSNLGFMLKIIEHSKTPSSFFFWCFEMDERALIIFVTIFLLLGHFGVWEMLKKRISEQISYKISKYS